MTPPMDVPWPPIHLVADSTTMSAPHASGLHVQPPWPKVLSQMMGILCLAAMALMASKSGTVPLGLLMTSK